MTYTVGSLFSGQDGIGLAFEQAGWRVRWQVEKVAFRRSVLKFRFPRSNVFEDVHHVGRHNLKSVTAVVGGFPCQPVSGAGQRKGTEDPRWLWPEFARIVGELRPRIVFLENADEICAPIRDGGRIIAAAPAVGVVADLTALRYDCRWGVVPAAAVGAPHKRDRWWCVAYTDCYTRETGYSQHQQRGQSATTYADGAISDADSFRRGWQLPPAIPVKDNFHEARNAALSGSERTAEFHKAQSGDTGVALGNTSRFRFSPDDWRRLGGTSSQVSGATDADPLRNAERTRLQGPDGEKLDTPTFAAQRFESEQIQPPRKSDVGRKLFDGLSGWLERLASEQRWAAPLGMQPYSFEPDRFTDDTFHWKDRIEALGDSVCVPLVRAFAEAIRESLDAEAKRP